jgi:hypothetical protein
VIELLGLISKEYQDVTITRAEYEKVVDFFNEGWDELPKGLKLDIDYAVDVATGKAYHNVKFLVESRYRRGPKQERYLAGGGFEINLDNFLRKIEGQVK